MLVDSFIKNLILKKTDEVGFIKTGFSRAEVLKGESEQLSQWLDAGYDADMKWIRAGFEKRRDIRRIMNDAKSVISLAFNYYTPFNFNDSQPKISRYSWGKDYHKVLKEKLKELCGYLEQLIPNSETKYYVDDGPVMEKVWAVRSGIGWMGKHTNVINPNYGSWIFLSEIISNIEFESYGEPMEDMCGECSLCIEACPTNAIKENYILDSNLCISYHTIENRGDIPENLNLDGWIFGCDICQDVCPFNKNDKPTANFNFYPSKEIFGKTADELKKISEEDFSRLFKDSPVRRTKYTGWQRNLNKFNQTRKEEIHEF